jgi:hypothetical protein
VDDIDAYIDAALAQGQQRGSSLGMCPNCKSIEWHGERRYNCPGSHVALSDKQLDAIQSEAVVNWECFGMGYE